MPYEELFTNAVKAHEMPKVVYHYCSMNAFLSIIESSSLRLSNITKSNDSTEITNVIPTLKEVTESVLIFYNLQLQEQFRFSSDVITALIDKFFDDISQNYYVICFSEKRDLLSQWARYADNANGVAIGFNTRGFVKLQVESKSKFIFGKIIYDASVLKDSVETFLHKQIDEAWRPNDDSYNVNIIENAIINMICTVLQYSVFFKDYHFSEESEWRLVYNPMGRIRRLGYVAAYHDRLIDTDQYRHEESGFERKEYQFRVYNGNHLTSFVNLDYSSIKDVLIQEILIGPKSPLKPDDKDLQMLLALHGYRQSFVPIEGNVAVSKSSAPIQ